KYPPTVLWLLHRGEVARNDSAFLKKLPYERYVLTGIRGAILNQNLIWWHSHYFARVPKYLGFRCRPVSRPLAIGAAAHDERGESVQEYSRPPLGDTDIVTAEYHDGIGGN